MTNSWWRSLPARANRSPHWSRDAMEHAVEIAVPLDVSTGLGADWQLAAH